MNSLTGRVLKFLALICCVLLWAAHVSAESYYLVTSGTSNSIRKYDAGGTYLGDLVSGDSGLLSSPQYMAVDDRGRLYVANYFANDVQVFDVRTGAHLQTLASGGDLANPAFLALTPHGTLVVSSLSNNRVLQFDPLTGDQLPDLIPQHQVIRPHMVTWDADGRMLISAGDNRIELFSPDGTWIRDLVSNSDLARPLNIQFSPDHESIIVSNFNGTVQRYEFDTGVALGRFTTDVTASKPDGMTYTPAGELLIAYWGSHQVRRYSPDGTLLGVFASGLDGLRRPNHILHVPPPASAGPFAILGVANLARRRGTGDQHARR